MFIEVMEVYKNPRFPLDPPKNRKTLLPIENIEAIREDVSSESPSLIIMRRITPFSHTEGNRTTFVNSYCINCADTFDALKEKLKGLPSDVEEAMTKI